MADEELDMEMISFGIVASAGQARSLAMEAIKSARTGDFEDARSKLKESEQAGLGAHNEQTKLLAREAGGDHVPVDILLVHSQDHLMTSMLAQDLAAELVTLFEEVAELKKQIETLSS